MLGRVVRLTSYSKGKGFRKITERSLKMRETTVDSQKFGKQRNPKKGSPFHKNDGHLIQTNVGWCFCFVARPCTL